MDCASSVCGISTPPERQCDAAKTTNLSNALEFVTEIEGIVVNGVDLIRWNDAGRIVDFKVMLRPLKAIQTVQAQMARLGQGLTDLPPAPQPAEGEPDTRRPVAALLVNSYGGLGIHTLLNVFRCFPGQYKGVVFLSVGVVDSGAFKGEGAIEDLTAETQAMLERYVQLARRLGLPAASRMAVGTDVVAEGENLCLATAREYPRTTFFAGKVIFQREKWYQRLLHNETAAAIEKRLQWDGLTMVVLPARVR